MDKKTLISWSKGKDSTALIEMCIEKGIHFDEIVTADVEKSFPQEEYYAKQMIERWESMGYKVVVLKTSDTWDQWFYGKSTRGKSKGLKRGFPLTCYACWWTRQAKVIPLEKYMKGHIRLIGYTSNEKSSSRKSITKRYIENGYIDEKNKDFKYPLIEWNVTEEDCMKYCDDRGLLNPLYKYFDRLGCYLCPKQNIKNLKILCIHFPTLWDELKEYTKSTTSEGFVSQGTFTMWGKTTVDYNRLIEIENELRY